MNEELAFAPATKLLALIKSGEVSPVDLTRLYLDRIERFNPQLVAYLSVADDAALTAARAAEDAVARGDELGPLHGLPIPIKESQNAAGMSASLGSVVFRDRVAEADSAVVERLRRSGAIILGKTNLSEFGMVGTCENTVSDLGRNPWNPDRTPGGSSAGAAAAVAAGLCPAATGSDGGGSIRIPAHFCGVYGIKPTLGRVSGYSGVSGPPMPNIFGQNGPLTRTVGDAALLLQILAGHDPRDPVSLRDESPDFVAATERDIKGLRVAWSPDFGFAQVHPDVIEVTSAAVRLFEELGCHVEEPGFVFPEPYDTFGPVFTADCYTNYGACLESHADQLTPHARFHFDKGAAATTADYARALGEIGLLKAKVADLFESYDLIMSPTACFPAFEYGEFPGEVSGQSSYPDQYWNGAFTCPINASGNPAASVPAGFSSEGLPIGLHIIGKKGDEETVIAASTAFERARPWIHHRPRIS